jgi:hypothetical protein
VSADSASELSEAADEEEEEEEGMVTRKMQRSARQRKCWIVDCVIPCKSLRKQWRQLKLY